MTLIELIVLDKNLERGESDIRGILPLTILKSQC